MRRIALLSIAFLALGAVLAAASRERPRTSRPDFTGQWALDLKRSRLERHFQDISSGTARIEHRDPSFAFSREFVQGGKKSTVAFVLTTDGAEVVGKEAGMPTRQTLTWSGDTLVFVTVYQAPLGEARNTVRYTLQDSGHTLQAEESFQGPRLTYENVWVFSKID